MQKFFYNLSKTLQLNNLKFFFLILMILIIYVATYYDQNISLIFYLKDGSHSVCDTPTLVFTLEPKDSTLQYKKFVHHWNSFPCIKTMSLTITK